MDYSPIDTSGSASALRKDIEQFAKDRRDDAVLNVTACRPIDPERFLSREMLDEEVLAIKLEKLLSRAGHETECDWNGSKVGDVPALEPVPTSTPCCHCRLPFGNIPSCDDCRAFRNYLERFNGRVER